MRHPSWGSRAHSQSIKEAKTFIQKGEFHAQETYAFARCGGDCGGALIPSVALAVQPDREDVPVDEPIELAGVCPFDVEIAPLSNGQTITTFFDRQLITGKLKVSVTNLETGESLDLNISGPGRTLIDEDLRTLIQEGPWLTVVAPGTFEEDPEFAGLFLTKGKVVSEFNADGSFFRYISFPNNVEDLCATLAS